MLQLPVIQQVLERNVVPTLTTVALWLGPGLGMELREKGGITFSMRRVWRVLELCVWLKSQDSIFSQVWRQEVWDQSVGRLVSQRP